VHVAHEGESRVRVFCANARIVNDYTLASCRLLTLDPTPLRMNHAPRGPHHSLSRCARHNTSAYLRVYIAMCARPARSTAAGMMSTQLALARGRDMSYNVQKSIP
jgi:hypothetical protein